MPEFSRHHTPLSNLVAKPCLYFNKNPSSPQDYLETCLVLTHLDPRNVTTHLFEDPTSAFQPRSDTALGPELATAAFVYFGPCRVQLQLPRSQKADYKPNDICIMHTMWHNKFKLEEVTKRPRNNSDRSQ